MGTVSALCLNETRALWDCGETGRSPVAVVIVAPAGENISVENVSVENMGILYSFSDRRSSVNSPPPCELTAKEEFKERKVPYQEAQICQVSWPYLHSQVHSPSSEF